MRRKLIYTLIAITCVTLSFLSPLFNMKVQKPIVPFNKITLKKAATKVANTRIALKKEAINKVTIKVAIKKIATKKIVTKKIATKKAAIKTEVLKTVTTHNSTLKQISFAQLPGWDEADVKKSLSAFQKSCETFLKQEPNHSVGSKHIHLKAKDWHPACKASVSIDLIDESTARTFFEKWFYPIELTKKKPLPGLFTGYYMPLLKGNLTRTKKYNTPIYGLPSALRWNATHKKSLAKNLSYYTREKIDNGALKKKAPVIAWINSPIERLFLEIEGSGVIKLSSGKSLYLGYAGENGAPYTSIGSVLIKKGIMTKDNASKRAITRYLKSKPKKANIILHKNKSFVFFQNLNTPMALGAQGMALTPGYSLAIDKEWIPLGAPLWLTTKIPDKEHDNEKRFQRLMIAQDTGGAINGLMRGDIYWGSGKKAAFLGEHMKNKGHYWLFLPKRTFDKLT